ncbi:MAG: TlpA family protein disulfide reductase [Desulfobulbaceae bacterium]|nr:TlpA family protein disulfide reductase [Desulfobulbaceae bacterium]
MKRIIYLTLFFIIVILIAVFSEKLQQPNEQCVVDGTGIVPISRVEIIRTDGKKEIFCSLCCAKTWIDNHKQVALALQNGKARLTVVDEISGTPVDSSLAYWVESDQFSRQENRCRVHVFKEKKDASRHVRKFNGKEKIGYLAGLGKQLAWAENFHAGDLAGYEHSLQDYRGKVIFLRFWSSANPFVETDLKNLQEVQNRFEKSGFTVLAVNVEDTKKKAAEIIQKIQVSYPVLLDPRGEIADLYQVAGFPTGFLIDRSGIVEESTIGEITADIMEPLLYPLW